jgi:hypothetical protein
MENPEDIACICGAELRFAGGFFFVAAVVVFLRVAVVVAILVASF